MADVNAAHVPSRRGLPQALRLTAAAVYVGYLLGLGLYLNDSLPPPFGLTGLWFYAAFAAIVLGDFIIEPFFTKPADALANAVAVLVAASVSLNGAVVSASDAKVSPRAARKRLGSSRGRQWYSLSPRHSKDASSGRRRPDPRSPAARGTREGRFAGSVPAVVSQ